MEKGLEKKYGLVTAICLVVGIVIGSGVFFKAEKILTATGGNLPIAILAWIIGGLIMIICAYTFSVMAAKYEKVNGIVDYAEVTVGKNYAYFIGWFMSVIYYPTLTSVLAWVCARYSCVLVGISDITGGTCMTIACFYLCTSYAINALSPRLAGKFQVATTLIKLIPLLLMAIIGTIVGIKSGTLSANFTTIPTMSEIIAVKPDYTPVPNALFTAIVAAAFAYEGWIIATSINSELKNGKKNLPIALVGGTFLIAVIYILYYIGLAGAADNITMIASGETGAKIAFTNILGSYGAVILMVFIVISCLGTLNGLMLACVRGIYSLAARNEGPNPKMFSSIDSNTNMPTNSGIIGLLLCGFWFIYFYGSSLTASWFGPLTFDQSELPIITIYAMYIPIFIMIMKKEKNFKMFSRFIAPFLSICGSAFMVYAAYIAHGAKAVTGYLIIFAVIMFIGALFKKSKVVNHIKQ
ncbi:MAG: APC family permease [Candidatus Metalachnospira sp.]|nr:APC family permease [Candidatus Metalachnospira sp.]